MARLIDKLSKDKQEILRKEYNEKKLDEANGWIAWFFGFHYIHIKKFGLWLLFGISCFFLVGFVRWIVQAIYLRDNIRKYNKNLKLDLYAKFK